MLMRAVGIAWFKEQNFKKLKELFEDSDKLSPTFAQWQNAAEAQAKHFQRQGFKVFKVDIDPVEFPKWCASRNLALNAEARTEFAAAMARRMAKDSAG